MVIAYFTFICIQSPLVGCILLCVSMVQVVPPLIFKGLYKKYDVEDKEIEKQSSDSVLELYNGFNTIKLFRLKERMLAKLKHLHDKWCGIANRLQATARTEEAVDKTMDNLLTYGTYAIIGLLILVGTVKTEAGIQAISLSSGLYAAVKTVFATITTFSNANVAETRMAPFWSTQDSEKQIISPEAGITFYDVSCVLDGKTIFSRLNLTLPLDGITIIRGENGSGKSTLVKLALGMIEGTSGDIYTGGVHPDCLSYENFPRKIFFLPQEDALYHLTPSEMYQMILNEEEIEIARSLGKRFGLSEETYDRIIPELSGGERKKVFLSLAFTISPEVMILDEPTNSLDEASCRTLYGLLSKRIGGTVIITHNAELSSMGSVHLCVQEGGVVVEKTVKRQIYKDVFRFIWLPLFISVLSSGMENLLLIRSADILGSFADTVFALDLSAGLQEIGTFAAVLALTILVVPALNFVGDVILVKLAMAHDRMVLSRFLDKRCDAVGEVDAGDMLSWLDDDPNDLRLELLAVCTSIVIIPVAVTYLMVCVLKNSLIYFLIVFCISLVKFIVPILVKKAQKKYHRATKEYESCVRAAETDFSGRAHLVNLFGISQNLIERQDRRYHSFFESTKKKVSA